MSYDKFLFPAIAVLLAIGIFFADYFVVPFWTVLLFLALCIIALLSFFIIRKGWGAMLSLSLLFFLIGFLRAQLDDFILVPPALLQWSNHEFQALMNALHRLQLNDESTALLDAMLLGDRGGLTDEVRQLYRLSGAAHVLALSGLHQGILFGLFNYLLLRILNTPLRYVVGGLELCLMWGYLLVTGMPVSLFRATLMMSLYVIGQMRMSGNSGWHTLGLAAFILLLITPSALYDVGFQLSFSAVAGLLLFYQPLAHIWLPSHRLFRWLWKAFLVSLSAQAFTLPFVLFYFHRFSILGVVFSPIYVLLTTAIIYSSLLLLVASPFIVATMFRFVVEGLVWVQHSMMRFSVGLSWHQIEDVYLPWESVVCLLLASVCLLPSLYALRQPDVELKHYRWAMLFRSWPYLLSVIVLWFFAWVFSFLGF